MRRGKENALTCEEIMTRDPKCCVPADTAARVAKIMKTEDVGAVPICQSRGSRKLIGIVTDRDLALHIVAEGRDPQSTKVEEVMTREPFRCRASDDLQKALDEMQTKQVRRIPIVDSGGQLVGIVSQADVAVRAAHTGKTGEMVKQISKPSTMHA